MHLTDVHAVDIDIEPTFLPFTDVVFRLFTRLNPTTPQVVNINNVAQLLNSNFNPAHQTRFHVHGWNGGGPLSGAFIRNALIANGEFNVFVVDWGLGAITPNYALARGRVNGVGAVVGQYADFLNENGVPFSAMSAIGHSLGGHIVVSLFECNFYVQKDKIKFIQGSRGKKYKAWNICINLVT